MIPTPDITNNAQFSQWVQSINSIIQLGAVGVLILLGLSLLLYLWITRNRKPANADSQVVITMLSGIVAKQDERQEKSEEANRTLIKEMSDHYTEGMTTIAEGMNKQADNTSQLAAVLKEINDNNKQQSLGVLTMRDDIRQMTERGSVPLQNLVTTADGIKSDTEIILEHIKKIEEILQKQADCVDSTERLKRLEELVIEKAKRDTSTNVAVTVNPLPADGQAGNLVADDGGVAGKQEAA